jgi:hypothetical protein
MPHHPDVGALDHEIVLASVETNTNPGTSGSTYSPGMSDRMGARRTTRAAEAVGRPPTAADRARRRRNGPSGKGARWQLGGVLLVVVAVTGRRIPAIGTTS